MDYIQRNNDIQQIADIFLRAIVRWTTAQIDRTDVVVCELFPRGRHSHAASLQFLKRKKEEGLFPSLFVYFLNVNVFF